MQDCKINSYIDINKVEEVPFADADTLVGLDQCGNIIRVTPGGELALESRVTYLEDGVNRFVVTSLDYQAEETSVNREVHSTNLFTGEELTTQGSIPIVSTETAGIVTPQMYELTTTNRDKIAALELAVAEGSGNIRLTVENTKADLDNYTLPPTAKEGDTAWVRQDETQSNYATEYVLDSDLQWQFVIIINSTTAQATNTSLGTVRGSTLDGKIFVESDGSQSVVGWDNLKNTKQDTLIPGDNISIVNNVISATGGGSGTGPEIRSGFDFVSAGEVKRITFSTPFPNSLTSIVVTPANTNGPYPTDTTFWVVDTDINGALIRLDTSLPWCNFYYIATGN